MASSKDRRNPRPGPRNNMGRRSRPAHLKPPSNTGAEAALFRSLVDSGANVTVKLVSGEQLEGRIRYYDRDCFSLRVSNGPKLLLRKASVLEILETKS